MRRRRLVIVVGVFLVTLALAAAASASCHPARSALSGHWQDGWISTHHCLLAVRVFNFNVECVGDASEHRNGEVRADWVVKG